MARPEEMKAARKRETHCHKEGTKLRSGISTRASAWTTYDKAGEVYKVTRF